METEMEKVKHLMALGFAFPCACCEKLWRKFDAGRHPSKELYCEGFDLGLTCGGPVAGLSFPHYEGPLTRQTIAMSCYHCGKPANKIFQADLDGGYVGACNEHAKALIPECINAIEPEKKPDGT